MASLTLEECELRTDSKYRQYVSAVDKALKSFEYTSEWADLISALGKLNKVLVSNIRYPVIPSRITISKRLAQCMHPALPSGVHLKALECYDIMFKCMGTNRLSQELFIYSAGLFPLFGHAAMNVRPALLTIYETHFVPLGMRLRPGLRGFLSGILPGLDEGSDHFDRTAALIQRVAEATEADFFFGCLWDCVLCNPAIRLPAITFTLMKLNKKLSMEDQLYIMGTNLDVTVGALCAAVQDSSVLVQRFSLDLLLAAFPMHNSQLTRADVVRLVTAAVAVLLRRDMSLNRRLYSWLLGSEVDMSVLTSEHPLVKRTESVTSTASCDNSSAYFDAYSRHIAIEALTNCLRTSAVSTRPDVRPYRLIISLLDKPEIGPPLLDYIMVEVLRALYSSYQAAGGSRSPAVRRSASDTSALSRQASHTSVGAADGNKQQQDLVKTANLLFGAFEPHYVWHYMKVKYGEACRRVRSSCDQAHQHASPSSTSTSGVSSAASAGGAAVQPVGSGDPDVAECCALIVFLLEVISTETSVEVQTEHLPDLVCCVLQSLSVTLTEAVGHLQPDDVTCSLDICRTVLNKVQPGVRRSRSRSVVAEPAPAPAPELPPEPDAAEPGSVADCARLLSALFASLVRARLLTAGGDPTDCRRRLSLPGAAGRQQRDRQLRQLLQSRLSGAAGAEQLPAPPPLPSKEEQVAATLSTAECHQVALSACAAAYLPAFQNACQLLVLLSSFPNLEDGEETPPNDPDDDGGGPAVFPDWLSSLLTIACFLPPDHEHSGFQFAAISALLDLVALVTSVGDHDKHSCASSPLAHSVAVKPLLNHRQYVDIMEHTVVTQLLTRRLWSLLSPARPALHLPCVDLMQLMLNLLPAHLVEEQLAAQMTHPDLALRTEAFRRFAVLWHLSREVSARRHIARSFDACLLLMLDCLRDPSGPLHAVARTWLTHTLQRGDITRIVEPLLLLLLAPSTARVSVQHIALSAAPPPAERDDDLNRVYAISSVEGNVIYHVSDELGAGSALARASSRGQLTSGSGSAAAGATSGGERKLMSLTMLGRTGRAPETRAGTVRLPGPHDLAAALLQPMSVFINPLPGDSDSETSDTPPPVRLDLSTVHRFPYERRRGSRDSEDDDSSCRGGAGEASGGAAAGVHPSEKSGSLTPCDGLSRLFAAQEESVTIAASIMNEVVDSAVDKCLPWEARQQDKTSSEAAPDGKLIHPLHTFMLLYCQVCDSQRILYALQTLRSILEADCRLTLCSLATTSVCSSASQTPGNRSHQIQVLLSCHKRSMQGQRFGGNSSNASRTSECQGESAAAYRSSMLLEVVLQQCVQFIRSYYPQLQTSAAVSTEQLRANRQVQIVSAEILTSMFSELVTVVRSSGRGFATYLADLLKRCKVQKTLLNCLLSTVHALRTGAREASTGSQTLTEQIVAYNEVTPPRPEKTRHWRPTEAPQPSLSFTETLQIQLIRLVLALLILEDQADQMKTTDVETSGSSGGGHGSRVGHQSANSSEAKFYPGHPVSAQPMLLNAILGALKQTHTRHLHHHWLSLVTSSLPFIRRPLPHVVTSVISQVVTNIEQLAPLYGTEHKLSADACVPPDHMVYLIESLTVICHFCMIDTSQQTASGASGPQPSASAAGSVAGAASDALHTYSPGSSASQVLNNLYHVFATTAQTGKEAGKESATEPLLNARRLLLSSLPRLMVGVASLWQSIAENAASQSASWVLGAPRVVKQQLLELLSPISQHHPAAFVAAVAVAWHERRMRGQPKQAIPEFCAGQLVLVELVSSIRVVTIDSLVQTVRVVVRHLPNVSQQQRGFVPCAALQFLLCYLRGAAAAQLAECWPSLLQLLRETAQLPAPAQFILLAALNEYVQRAPPQPEKKDHRDLQDVAAKLVEACSGVAGACLEQTTWLRRNLAVKTSPAEPTARETGTASPEPGSPHTNGPSSDVQWSVQALRLLARLLAPLLDVLYQSDEKDRVLPLLIGVMCHVTPYLKNHSRANAASFLACSELLASLSEYQYSRRAWRREAFDLLLEPAFFCMEPHCLPFWRTTIDNMMTHDKTTFKELLARVVVSQPGTLSLFSSREAEYDQRAQLLKRLAVVVFCSDEDQYQPHLPEIQEKLAESLRLPQVAPSIQSAVMLCFRVLLLRMSPRHVVSLWPSIITEMVQVFLQIEHQLHLEADESNLQMKRMSSTSVDSALSSWTSATSVGSAGASNGLSGLSSHPGWLQLQLETCKLLDMCLTLPAHRLPQFQMYRWAFVGSAEQPSPGTPPPAQRRRGPPSPAAAAAAASADNAAADQLQSRDFVPHVTRLTLLVTDKCKPSTPPAHDTEPSQLLLRVSSIRCSAELYPFYVALGQGGRCSAPAAADGGGRSASPDEQAVRAVERVLAADFLEPLSANK